MECWVFGRDRALQSLAVLFLLPRPRKWERVGMRARREARPIRFTQGDSLPNLLGSESVSHGGEEFAERRAAGDIALHLGVLNELFQDDLILDRQSMAPGILAE